MINDALTGRLRGEDGNFLFYETDADGNPILVYEADGVTPVIDPITGEQLVQHFRPFTLNPPPYDRGVPLFIRDVDVVVNPSSPTGFDVNYTWPIAEHENPNDATTIFTATNIRINPNFSVAGGHNLFGLSMSGAPGDTDLLVALQQVWMSDVGPYAVTIGERSFNVQDAYIRFTGNIATEVNEANTKVNTQTITTDQAQNMRMAIKGVSMDEELNAMLRFQFAFQAASRVFNMIDGMIDRIVNGTGRVGL
jgi:hypothetical protein